MPSDTRAGLARHVQYSSAILSRHSPCHPRAHKDGPVPYGVCLLHPIRTALAGRSATTFESLGTLLSRHRAVTRVSLAALSFTFIVALSQQAARPFRLARSRHLRTPNRSCHRASANRFATGDADHDPLRFRHGSRLGRGCAPDPPGPQGRARLERGPHRAGDPPSRALADRRALRRRRRRLGATADGEALDGTRRFAFSTQPPPSVSDFQVRLAPGAEAETAGRARPRRPGRRGRGHARHAWLTPPTKTATDVSATSAITISFNASMDHADVEEHFAIAPDGRGRPHLERGRPRLHSHRPPRAGRALHDQRHRRARRSRQRARREGQLLVRHPAWRAADEDPAGGRCDRRRAGDRRDVVQPADGRGCHERGLRVERHLDRCARRRAPELERGRHPADLRAGRAVRRARGRTRSASRKGARDADGNAVTTTWSFETKAGAVRQSRHDVHPSR